MEAIITVSPGELTEQFFEQLKTLATNASSVEIRVNTDETELTNPNGLSDEEIGHRLRVLNRAENTVRFTMPELQSFIQQIAGA